MVGEVIIDDHVVEWDDEKNEKNFRKHKIRFEIAARVFLDENRLDDYDVFHSDYEDRIKIIGRVGKVLVVIYTERGENYRLISARYANKKEADDYYGQYSYL